MKIVFFVPGTEGRPKPINGHTIRFGNAPSSGTEQSVILVAEYLAKHQHDVTIVLDKTDFETVNNVKYTDFTYSNIDSEVDILVTMLWYSKYDEIPFKVKKKVIHWFHMAWGYGVHELGEFCKEHNLPLTLVSPSSWAQFNNNFSYEIHRESGIKVNRFIIPNPLDTSLIQQVKEENIQKDPNKVIFHAQFSRGGTMVVDTMKAVDEKLYIKHFDYVDAINGIGKLELLREIASSTYFIFPLVNHAECVYQETFSCAVAEAIAMNVKVITYPLGGFTEHFNGLVHYADIPEGVNTNKLFSERVSCEMPEMRKIDTLIKALNLAIEQGDKFIPHLEANSNNFIKYYSDSIIGEYWEDII